MLGGETRLERDQQADVTRARGAFATEKNCGTTMTDAMCDPWPRLPTFSVAIAAMSLEAYSADVMDSKPLFAMVGAAAGDARNLISALPASGSLAPTATPAENTVIF